MNNRRQLLHSAGFGFGTLALHALLPRWAPADARHNPLAPRAGHHPATAKRVIFLFMNGGPSHHETFDYRPELARTAERDPQYLAPALPFNQCGGSGLWISEAFPELARHADDLCILNGMQTNTNDHLPAVVRLHTGNEMFVRPSLGSWIVYGLGSDAEDLPGFITINPMQKLGGASNYGSAFLPAGFQGTAINGGAEPVANLSSRLPARGEQRRQLDFVRRSNQRLVDRFGGNPEFEGVLSSYELAFRMQTSVPETFDLGDESDATRELYGLHDRVTASFGERCLIARRLAERGVRFIQLSADGWDNHAKVGSRVRSKAAQIDKPVAGLLADLKSRDMLKDTLLIWGGEFGRTARRDKSDGRNHNGGGFTFWLAGGGVRGGFVHGDKDELGDKAVEGVMNFHDLHATVLHLLGLDHERLTYRYAGRDFRLTDTEGNVVREILA